MKIRIFILYAAAVVALSCSEKTEVIPAFQPGSAVAVCSVDAQGGGVSVLVETEGNWRLRCADSWISTDVPGGSGKGAFTFSCLSNQSDILNLRPCRTGRIAICMENTARADTLIVVQQGFLSSETNYPVTADPALKLEFETPAAVEVKLLVASSEGASFDAVSTWVQGYGATVSVLDGVVSGAAGGLNVLGCNFEGQDPEQELDSFRDAVASSVGMALEKGNDWIVCGQMYHYSAMQVGYPDTPSWYPANASGDEFRADRYAWQNNLYDLLWMKTRGWVSTYSDAEGHNWQADYVYASASILDKVSSVELIPSSPVPGMKHKPVEVVLKY